MSAELLLRRGILPLVVGRRLPDVSPINYTPIIQRTLARFPGAVACCDLRFGDELDITDGYFECIFPHLRQFAEEDAFLEYAEQTIVPTVVCYLCDQLNLRSWTRQLDWIQQEVAGTTRPMTILAGSFPTLDGFFTEAASGHRFRVDCKVDWRIGTSTVLVLTGSSKPILSIRVRETSDEIHISGGISIPSTCTVRRTTCDPRRAEQWQVS